MPRDGSNIYHRPAGTDGVPNFPIESSKYNAYVADVEQDLNLPRPIVAGGTGATNADGALTNLSAEKAAQIVTNWDATAWMAGSYYAATTATGIAPVTGHAFAGIAYVSNATVPITDMVLEATDLSDPPNPDKYIRIMSAGVWSPWTRVNPSTSSANLGEYTFNNQVTFPPASGQIRFNNATENLTTEVFISHLSATGVDNTSQITSYVLSGVDLVVQDKDEGNKYKVFTTTAAAVLSGGDFRVTVALKIAGIDVVTAQRMIVTASSEAQRVQQRQLIYAAPFDALAYNGMQINGSMDVSQEKGITSTSVSGAVVYIVDGWRVASVGAQVTVGAPAPGSVPTGFRQSVQIRATTANASPAAGDICYFSQPIEAYRMLRLAWGTAGAQPTTIGFWVFSTVTGLFSGAVGNGASDRSYVFSYTVNAINTWEYKTITIPGDTTGSWATDNTAGMFLYFTMMTGSTYLTSTVGSWLAGNKLGATGTTNLIKNTTDFILLTGVVVLPGIEAPSAARSPLIMRPYDQELLTCQRYFQKVYTTIDITANAGTSLSAGVCFQPAMRGVPTTSWETITFIPGNISSLAATPESNTGAYLSGTITNNGRSYFFGNVIANARL